MKAFSNMYDVNIKGMHPLNPMLTLRASSYAGLCTSEDLFKFADWALDRGRLDYLEPWPLGNEDPHCCNAENHHVSTNPSIMQ